ncbi:hypothetical protein SERLA73DRAFT_180193 [Serpula lacrymans var. lacrymans S7.3]|uniref:Translation initiation factor eIF2B subunit gamma n=2 Tax=Serpula lacrymans var. lacrymans TaxID=341189 RepID=F8PW44_SERL3|nr:uncharacterized protein SERLADRAFT_465689 [Serpula lacrymans var. lacrymans S7.9]EGN99903.1 hypothetical protein SERLA73DRAFT_180193 [Serpula lacrymans var. lacrymans S7.3]EGO25471.1 hypothetical protein SERLADRAFT_465689 [Serpula lacrymans var. lacrymans S7.9]
MNFNVTPVEAVTREFLAVVLAGFGNELLPLTSEHGEEPCPKALLPIFNKPMLDYPLSWLEQSGIKDVLLICPSSHRAAISHYIHSDSTTTSFASLRIDLQPFDESQDLSSGTCSLLKHFASRIQDDFVLLPCDFIPPPSLPLSKLLNKFRTESATDGAIATTCWFEAQRTGSSPDEWGASFPSPSIVWDEVTGTLLHVDVPDGTDHRGELELRMGLLTSYPRAKLSSKFHDSHVYVCKRAVLDVLLQKHHFDSLREDFFPWLCKIQYQNTKRIKYGHALGALADSISNSISMKHSTLHTNVYAKIKLTTLEPRTSESSPQQSRIGLSMPSSPAESDIDQSITSSLRIGVIIHRAENGFTLRANNLGSYLDVNRHFLTSTSYSLPSEPQKRALIDQKANISSDSAIGDFTRVEEKTSIKRSIVGSHCVIGKMVKIVGCVLLDHCVISDGAKLEGCILGKNTTVGVKAELIRCVTQAGYEVEENGSYRNEKLDVADWAAGPEDSSSDEDDDEDEEEDEEDEDEDESEESET